MISVVRFPLAFWILSLTASSAFASAPEPHNGAEAAFLAYVDATRTRNLEALNELIANDSMTINGQLEVATKQSELAETKNNPAFNRMEVNELHSLLVKNTAVMSGVISVAYTNKAGEPVETRVRVLATLLKRHGRWQIVADESAPAH